MNQNKREMTKEEEEVKQSLERNEDMLMQNVYDAINQFNGDTKKHLAKVVASLCDVNENQMFSKSKTLGIVQARWLFFYAYRYMTNDTYEKIGKVSESIFEDCFSKMGVAKGVYKMSNLIEHQPVWRKRWNIIKHLIKSQSELIYTPDIPITITVPKNVVVTIKKE